MRATTSPWKAAVFLGVLLLTSSGIVSVAAAANDQPSSAYTSDQAQAAKKIFAESYARMEETRQALALKQGELNRELASAQPDKDKIEALSTEMGKLRGQLLAARVEARQQLEAEGLPADCYGRRPAQAYGPCWGGPADGGRGGWYHHGHGGHGGHGSRGGCWR